MAEKPKITDAEFEVVNPPSNPVAHHVKEPALTRGWWWKLALFLGFFGGLTLWRLYAEGDWPFNG